MVSLTRNPRYHQLLHPPTCPQSDSVFQEVPVPLQDLDFALSQPAQNIARQDLVLDLLIILAALQTAGVLYSVS